MTKQGTILVVDDNKGILTAVQMLLGTCFEKVITISTPNKIKATLHDENIDVVLLDMNFSAGINTGNEGLFWLSEIKKEDASIQVVLFTAYADIDLAVRGIKEGAADFVVKPWDNATVAKKMAMARESGCFALAMDIDAAGLPFLQHLDPPAGSKTVEQLQEIAKSAGVPFILKGIMTVSGAEKAVEAGAAGIVVSNHGGRVLDDCPATAEVLADIVAAVDGRAKILVDGGIRTGNDVFKALALGADGVLIARPFVTAVYGGGADGVAAYTEKLGSELADTMRLCGAPTLDAITRDMVRIIK